MPQRIQISRAAGARMAPGAVIVDRGSSWGNPFRADKPHEAAVAAGARSAAHAFRLWLEGHPALASVSPAVRAFILANMRAELRGRDLACWCGPGDECHADVLLDLANSAAPLPDFDAAILARAGQDLPEIALSVRQPWAWAILSGGKPVENRSQAAIANGRMRDAVGRRIAIHAARGMTVEEYRSAEQFMRQECGVRCPAPHMLARGGIIGSVHVEAIVADHASPWFFGPRALVLTDPQPCEFIASPGELGLFRWRPGGEAVPPARWMLPKPPPVPDPQGGLL